MLISKVADVCDAMPRNKRIVSINDKASFCNKFGKMQRNYKRMSNKFLNFDGGEMQLL